MVSFLKTLTGRHLLATNLGASVILSGLGDFLIQQRDSPARWNPTRSCHMGISFGLTSGFLCHYWYDYLDKKLPGKTIGIITRKIVYDQLLFSPVCIVACLTVAGLIENQEAEHIWLDVIEKGVQLYLAEWFVWPPAQFFNFYFLPTRFRVIYDNLVSIGYDMYTSHVTHAGLPRKRAGGEARGGSSPTGGERLKESAAEKSIGNCEPDPKGEEIPKHSNFTKSIIDSKHIWALNLNFDTGDW